jgi:multidrug efflux system outer membrane protein
MADFLPTIDANASYVNARKSRNSLTFSQKLLDTEMYQAGFDANWEIDIFGGKRRGLEAANATLASIEADHLDVLVTLLGDVARYYIDLRGFQRRISIARQNIQAQQEALEITQLRLKAGLASELDVSQATAVLETTRADIPTLETSLQVSIHRLSVLLGRPPGTLVKELSKESPIPLTPPTVPVGLPADLLLRRPDIRSSERKLAAANAQIGVATAELFPKFFLTGTAGFESLHGSDLISPESKLWSAGPSVTWRLLEYPRLKAAISSQNAQQQQALAQYNQIVLTSLEEVENALVAYGKEQERWHSLNEAVKANRHALELANELYTKGLGEFLNVLDAERSLYQAEDQFIQSERTVSVNLVSLYKALGGGWETEQTKQ